MTPVLLATLAFAATKIRVAKGPVSFQMPPIPLDFRRVTINFLSEAVKPSHIFSEIHTDLTAAP